jgi:5-methylthioadenosine/S-adenosylhomocysteine deaminase
MLIQNTTVLSFHDLSMRPNTDLLIEGQRIEQIGEGLPASGEVIDGSGCYLIPGLVNAHSHTAMTLLRGVAEDVSVEEWFNKYIWMYEKNLTAHDVYVGTLLGAAEMLLSGVTLVADHYFHMDQAARAYTEAGMRADLTWAVFGVGEGWQARYEQAHRGGQG